MSTQHRFNPAMVALACAALSVIGARADQLGRQQVSQGYMVSSCGGFSTGDGYGPGDPMPIYSGLPLFDCHSAQSTQLNGSVSQSASFIHAGYQTTAQAQGSANWGSLKLAAAFSGSNTASFPTARATGGWVDRLRFDAVDPAYQGSQGVMHFNVHVEGVLDALPIGNSRTSIGVRAYHNDAGQSGSGYVVQGQGQLFFPYHQVVDTVAALTLSFTFGTEFEFGLFAAALSGTASQYYDPYGNNFSAASSDFANTITWQGIGGVTRNGIPVDYLLHSQSTVDWKLAYSPQVPEPASYALMALGLAGMGALAWRRRADGPGSSWLAAHRMVSAIPEAPSGICQD